MSQGHSLFYFLSFVLAAGCAVEADKKKPSKRPNPLVEVGAVRKGTLTDKWLFFANVRPMMRAALASGASGAVAEVAAREGDRVKKNALLLKVDSSLATAKLRVAQAKAKQAGEAVAQARREHQRLLRLPRRSRSQLELERAQSNVALMVAAQSAAKAETAYANALLNRYRVRAPFSAIIAKRRVDPGDWVQEGTPVLDIVSSDDLEVVADVPANLLAYVRKGDSAILRAAAEESKATITGIVPSLDSVSRTARIRISPNKAERWLRPGAAISAEFAIHYSGKGVVVARDALLAGPVSTKVVRIKDGVAEMIEVKILATASKSALVAAQGKLAEGDQVVTRGNERLRPGQKVRIAK
jgi:RND family efflux transporter MFP subunit